jgi:hypothetical protein
MSTRDSPAATLSSWKKGRRAAPPKKPEAVYHIRRLDRSAEGKYHGSVDQTALESILL